MVKKTSTASEEFDRKFKAAIRAQSTELMKDLNKTYPRTMIKTNIKTYKGTYLGQVSDDMVLSPEEEKYRVDGGLASVVIMLPDEFITFKAGSEKHAIFRMKLERTLKELGYTATISGMSGNLKEYVTYIEGDWENVTGLKGDFKLEKDN